jgi:MFS family permease
MIMKASQKRRKLIFNSNSTGSSYHPSLCCFFLSFLDRSNIGNAKLDNLTTDLHITGEQYLVILSVFFIRYSAFEIPSNIALKLTSPRIWLPTLMLVWGVVATLMALSTSFGGLLAAGFFLGATEAGVFPGAIFYLSMWYRRKALVRRVTLFYIHRLPSPAHLAESSLMA